MNKFLFFIFILIISCNFNNNQQLESNKKVKKIDLTNLDRVWMLTEFKNYEKQFLINAKAQLDLTALDNALANMGCNGISFKYNLKSNSQIIFTEGIRTEMACGDMKLEDDFLAILPKINAYKIIGHRLILSTDNGIKMVFVAKDWD